MICHFPDFGKIAAAFGYPYRSAHTNADAMPCCERDTHTGGMRYL